VALVGPADTRVRFALLDTGADECIFPESVAGSIGIDLANAPGGSLTPASGGTIPLRYAQVLLRLTDGREQREWPAMVGFTPVRLVYAILGFAGCLQFFTAEFFGDIEEVELTVNSLYPGT
jgi:hypothetical protein